jgi:hypothetical protein
MRPKPHRVAVRLGLDEATIGRLQARGYLGRLALTEPEIRERLYRAHLAYLLTRAGGKGHSRRRTTPLCLLVAMLAIIVPHSASAVATGEKTVLVVLATSGPHPYAVAEVERTMRTADDFLRSASLGHLQIDADVTPWLAAFTSDPGCGATNRSLEVTLAPARLAAERAGYHASRYDDVIYAIADAKCGFQGAAWGHEVMLARQPTLRLVVHELGHAFGLAHAQSSNCAENRLTCGLDDTGDPFSPMGSGNLDFSVYEKVHPRMDSPPTACRLSRALCPRPSDDQDERGAGALGHDGTGNLVDRVSLATVPRTSRSTGLWRDGRLAARPVGGLDHESDEGRPDVDCAWRDLPHPPVDAGHTAACRSGSGRGSLQLVRVELRHAIARAYFGGDESKHAIGSPVEMPVAPTRDRSARATQVSRTRCSRAHPVARPSPTPH